MPPRYAVISYFHVGKHHPGTAHWFRTLLAPLLGWLGMLYVVCGALAQPRLRRRRGRLALFGTANGELPILDFVAQIGASRLGMNQTLGFFGLHYYQAHARAELAQALDELADHVRTKQLRLSLGLQLPLSAAADAHQLIESLQSTGKVVLLPWAD